MAALLELGALRNLLFIVAPNQNLLPARAMNLNGFDNSINLPQADLGGRVTGTCPGGLERADFGFCCRSSRTRLLAE